MTGTVERLNILLGIAGSDVIFHREDNGAPCPCRTPEGFRNPSWHRLNPSEPVCNEQGFLSTSVTEIRVKATIQPPRLRGNRGAQRVDQLLGEVRSDDRIGIFPVRWEGKVLDFSDWSDAGEDFIVYDGKRYVVVQADKIADIDGNPDHHFEVGLRLVKTERPT